jgi:hypothetical protein
LSAPEACAHAENDVAQVVLLAILYESHAWRQTVWHVVDEAVVVESKVGMSQNRLLQLGAAPKLRRPHRSGCNISQHLQNIWPRHA